MDSCFSKAYFCERECNEHWDKNKNDKDTRLKESMYNSKNT